MKHLKLTEPTDTGPIRDWNIKPGDTGQIRKEKIMTKELSTSYT